MSYLGQPMGGGGPQGQMPVVQYPNQQAVWQQPAHYGVADQNPHAQMMEHHQVPHMMHQGMQQQMHGMPQHMLHQQGMQQMMQMQQMQHHQMHNPHEQHEQVQHMVHHDPSSMAQEQHAFAPGPMHDAHESHTQQDAAQAQDFVEDQSVKKRCVLLACFAFGGSTAHVRQPRRTTSNRSSLLLLSSSSFARAVSVCG